MRIMLASYVIGAYILPIAYGIHPKALLKERENMLNSEIIQQLAANSQAIEDANVSLSEQLFDQVKETINSNDANLWKPLTLNIAAILGFKSLNEYATKTGNTSFASRIAGFKWAVEGVLDVHLETYADYLAALNAKKEKAKAEKAAKESGEGEGEEEGPQMDVDLLAALNSVKSCASLTSDHQKALAKSIEDAVAALRATL